MKEPMEIERKFLIRRPDPEILKPRCSAVYRMEQTYLTAPEGITARVRRRVGEREEFFYTEKEYRTARSCVERERSITRQEYESLLQRRETETICKTRYCLPYAGHTLEIDLYPFWQQLAVLEVELQEEGEPFRLPPEITVVREVTEDRRLKNAALARHIPPEEELLGDL